MVSRSLLLALTVAACTTTSTPPSATTPTPAVPPAAIHWTRTAAEHRALFVQTYRNAADQLRELVRGRTSGWAVIMDADETVLDNSEYQRRIALRGATFDIDTWNAWVREVAADTLAGAPGFVRLVNQLGGRVVIVTGREEVVCAATRDNLRRFQIEVAAVLCQQPGERGKTARFRAVADGTTPASLPRLDVVMYVGDNIQDFPDMTQELRNAPHNMLDKFGREWFILPNPMYGSWERNAAR
jgi:acid phosphatase